MRTERPASTSGTAAFTALAPEPTTMTSASSPTSSATAPHERRQREPCRDMERGPCACRAEAQRQPWQADDLLLGAIDVLRRGLDDRGHHEQLLAQQRIV